MRKISKFKIFKYKIKSLFLSKKIILSGIVESKLWGGQVISCFDKNNYFHITDSKLQYYKPGTKVKIIVKP